MLVTVQMSKDEFLEYTKFEDYKKQIKCGIIDLNNTYNDLLHLLLEEQKWQDKNKVDKLVKKMSEAINALERSGSCDNTKS